MIGLAPSEKKLPWKGGTLENGRTWPGRGCDPDGSNSLSEGTVVRRYRACSGSHGKSALMSFQRRVSTPAKNSGNVV